MTRLSLFTIILGLAMVLLANLFLAAPEFSDPGEKGKFLLEAGRYWEAEKAFETAAKKHPSDIDAQYQYIDAHFKAEENNPYANHEKIIGFYDSLSNLPHPDLAGIGEYGKGLIYSYQDRVDKALLYLRRVKNTELKYLNNSLGWCFMKQGKTTEPEQYFAKEIALKGNVHAAYQNLAHLYKNHNNPSKLHTLLANPEASRHIEFNLQREFYFREGNLLLYFYTVFESVKARTTVNGFIAALFILIIWIIYLRKLDVYEPEKWQNILITLFLGVLFAQGAFLLADFNELILENKLRGEFMNDFFYCFFGIGAVEELVKIIPLLLMLVFTREINEPVDYIRYASTSAAAFAFMENLLYFNNNALQIIPNRALICVTGHMFYSSLIAYGIMLSKYKKHKYSWATIIAAFLVSSFCHGFYDFWLINQTFHEFSQISFLFFIGTTLVWMVLVNNCLSNSPFHDDTKQIDLARFREYLFISLLAVFILQYLLISFKLGPEEGNKALLKESMLGIIILPIVVRNMSNIRILKNSWKHL